MYKVVLFLSLVVIGFSSCKKYGCSCDGQPVTGETYTQREPGKNVAKLSCEASSNCDWVVVE